MVKQLSLFFSAERGKARNIVQSGLLYFYSTKGGTVCLCCEISLIISFHLRKSKAMTK